ncbi:MAG: hypothetical protein ABR905_02305 [Terracidiphilus sp.]|jgi:uncharacterized membrane protein
MIPLIVLAISFVAFRLAGFEIAYFADWQNALRAALGVMFLLTASAHWGKRRVDLVQMVPKVFGPAETWVTLTGIAELLIVLGLQFPRVAPAVAAMAAVMLVCIFPANVKAARERLTIGGRPVPGLAVRSAIQIVFLLALAVSVWPRLSP